MGTGLRRPAASSVEALRRMERQKRRDTKPEISLRSALHRRGLRFRVDRRIIPGSRKRADIVFGPERLAIFVDGCFWHGCPEHGTWPKANPAWWRNKIEANRARDVATNRELADAGWSVLRFWAHEEVDAAVAAILDVLDHARTRRLARQRPPATA